MITLDDAIRYYTEKRMNELRARDRAQVEALVWSMTPKNERLTPGGRGRSDIGEFFVAQGADGYNDVKFRHTLHRALGTESMLWDEIETKGMTLSAAARVLRNAIEIRKQTGGGLEHAISAALDSYHGEHRETRVSQRGTKYKVRSPNIRPKTTPFARGKAQTKLFTEVRAAIEAYVTEALAGMPEYEANDARLEIVSEFDLAVLSAARIVARAHHLVEEPKREAVRDACLRLGIATPYNGRAPDMQAAKKAYRGMVLQLHPDRRGGTDDTREALEAAIAAYTTLEDYMLYLNSKRDERDTP